MDKKEGWSRMHANKRNFKIPLSVSFGYNPFG